MRTILFAIILSFSFFGCDSEKPKINQEFVSTDVDNYWEAYDKIVATNDSILQYQYINDLYINKGSEGLKNIMIARSYTAQNYIAAINDYPKFWASVRENTQKSKGYEQSITESIAKLKAVYPELELSPIYFTIGSFKTNGTILEKKVLIGNEMAFADKSTYIEELPEWRKPFFKEYNPIEGIELLCTHEYVHTQQSALVDNLLTYCLYEGVAEFVSTHALEVPSKVPSIAFGKANEAVVKKKFEEDIFISQNTYNWIWGENRNELKERDLGYYIGYAICESYYKQAADKAAAIKEMIELDYSNEAQVEAFVDAAAFLSVPLQELYDGYEASRPTVLSMEPAVMGIENVSPQLKKITLNFSTAMDKESRGFDFGPLGEEGVLRVQKIIGFSEDGTSFSFEVSLKPNKQYQSLVTNRFVSENGTPLQPFLIDFKTGKK